MIPRSRPGRAAVLAAVAVAVAGATAGVWAETVADGRARAAGDRLRAQLAAPAHDLDAPYRLTARLLALRAGYPSSGDDVYVAEQVEAVWASRCVVAHRAASGEIDVVVTRGSC